MTTESIPVGELSTLTRSADTGILERLTGHPCIVYSGPHYGRKHTIASIKNQIVRVIRLGEEFSVPICDVEIT